MRGKKPSLVGREGWPPYLERGAREISELERRAKEETPKRILLRLRNGGCESGRNAQGGKKGEHQEGRRELYC